MRTDLAQPFGGADENNSTHRYLPVMIGRLMLSLKKAADASRTQWSLTSMVFAPGQGGYTSKRSRVQFAPVSNRDTELRTDGDIPLGTVSPPIP